LEQALPRALLLEQAPQQEQEQEQEQERKLRLVLVLVLVLVPQQAQTCLPPLRAHFQPPQPPQEPPAVLQEP